MEKLNNVEYYTTTDLMETLNKSYPTIINYLEKKKLKGRKIGKWLVTKQELEEFINPKT